MGEVVAVEVVSLGRASAWVPESAAGELARGSVAASVP
jgi:hypothetical protein